jgi:spermidine synthase
MIQTYDPLMLKLDEARSIAKKLKRWRTFRAITKVLKITGIEYANRKTLDSFNRKENF